jgi:hypothetical protein
MMADRGGQSAGAAEFNRLFAIASFTHFSSPGGWRRQRTLRLAR